MELVKRLNQKRKEPKLRETRFGVVSFICALLTLAYLNIFLITLNGIEGISSLFFQIIPVVGIVSALVSFTRLKYKKTFTWWALALYLIMLILVVVIGFSEFVIFPKP